MYPGQAYGQHMDKLEIILWRFRVWLESKRASVVLTPGLLSSGPIRWSVAIDSLLWESPPNVADSVAALLYT